MYKGLQVIEILNPIRALLCKKADCTFSYNKSTYRPIQSKYLTLAKFFMSIT